MVSLNCRCKDNRIRLVKEYEIIPISHLPLLKGQKKYSAARDTIIKEYYCFSYKKENTNDKPETFIVGMHAAKHFLELLNHEPIPIFNILNYDVKSIKNHDSKSISSEKEKWNSLALELYRVINIILMVWDSNGGTLSDILLEITNNKGKKPEFRLIKSVNTIIGKDRKNRTINQMIDEIKKNNDIKIFDFPNIREAFKESKESIENHILSVNNE